MVMPEFLCVLPNDRPPTTSGTHTTSWKTPLYVICYDMEK